MLAFYNFLLTITSPTCGGYLHIKRKIIKQKYIFTFLTGDELQMTSLFSVILLRMALRYYELYYYKCNSHPNFSLCFYIRFILHEITIFEICIFAYSHFDYAIKPIYIQTMVFTTNCVPIHFKNTLQIDR